MIERDIKNGFETRAQIDVRVRVHCLQCGQFIMAEVYLDEGQIVVSANTSRDDHHCE